MEYTGTWVFKCRNVGKHLYGCRGEATVEAESLDRAAVEIRKAGARALFSGTCGMWPNFDAEDVRLTVEYEGTWVCRCHNLGLYMQRGKARVTAGSPKAADILIRKVGACVLFDGLSGMWAYFVAKKVKAVGGPAGQTTNPA